MLFALYVSFKLFLGVALISLVIGTFLAVCAWQARASVRYFPLLILSLPPWLLGYLLDWSFQPTDRQVFAYLSLGISCTPYVYILVLNALLHSSSLQLELLRVYHGTAYSYWLSVRPALKQAIIPALAVIGAETLSDLATVSYFGIPTLSLTTYHLWVFNHAVPWFWLLVLISLSLVVGSAATATTQYRERSALQNESLWATLIVVVLPLVLIGYTLVTSLSLTIIWPDQSEIGTSVLLISLVVLFCVILSPISWLSPSLAVYALPGVAIGILLLALPVKISLFVLLIIGLVLRYLGLAVATLKQARQTNILLIEIQTMLAWRAKLKLFFTVYRPALFSAGILISLEVLREIPISLLLQPFDFVSLGLRMHYLAATENIEVLGGYAFILISLGLVLVSALIMIEKKLWPTR